MQAPVQGPRRARTRSTYAARPAALVFLFASTLWLSACGAGAGAPPAGSGGSTTVPPSNVAYATSPAVYRTDTPITPNMPTADGDPVTIWQIAPALPGGLSFDPATGEISGMSLLPSPPTPYLVTAINDGGSDDVQLVLEVQWHESKSLAPKIGVTDADLRHFLDRTHFGFSATHHASLQQLGLPAYLDAMATFADTTQLETDATNAYFIDPVNDPNGDFPSESDLARWWQYMMILNPNPFQENLAYHWHEHFAANSNVLDQSATHFFPAYVNLFRHGGTGNLRDLLLAMALDHTMLVFLDGVLNQDGNINENFGREWFELFAMGVDVDYTQADIVEASRAFTGFRLRFNSTTGKSFIEFDPGRHDHGAKTILGQTVPAQAPGSGEVHDYGRVVDITLGHDEAGTGVSRVGQWIVRSLLRYFCYPDPPQNVIDELANDLRAGGWELKPVFVKLFQSETFFSALARESLVKGPLEHVMGFMRATNLLGDPRAIDPALTLMGHRPTQPPTVDGWPGGTQWLSGQGMVDRANLIHYLTVSAESLQANLGIFALALLPAPGADSGATVDAIAARLHVPLTPAERATCTTYLDTQRSNGGAVTNDPFNPTGNPGEAEDRVRGLLYILAQHPSYMIR